MDTFPEPDELVWFFESEPELSDKNILVSSYYKECTYSTHRGTFDVKCTFWPSGREISLLIHYQEQIVLDLNLNNIESVQIRKVKEAEYLEMAFGEGSVLKPLYLYLKPIVMVRWGVKWNP